MAYTIKLTLFGRPETVKWDNGTISADELVEAALAGIAEALSREGRTVGPIGMDLDPQDWKDGLAFLFLCKAANEDGEIGVTGQVPEPPEVPAGAII